MVYTDCGRNFTADTGAVSCAGNSGSGKADPSDQSWNWNFSDRDILSELLWNVRG